MDINKCKILFLHSQLSGYFQSCINNLANQVVQVHVVHWPLSSEAPFTQSYSKNVFLYERSKYASTKSLKELVNSINPQIVISNGWMDKGYLNICKSFKKRVPIIMSMDNHWLGTIKQRIASLLSPYVLLNTFTHIWIPGEPQKSYAKKLKFNENQILEGYYCADVDLFNKRINIINDYAVPKRFLYIGRYIHQKNLNILFEAFLEIQNEMPNEWELWCIGTGPLWSSRPMHEKIKHFGFLQPNEIIKILDGAGIFVLPSSFEPWGVVVHEMAASGFPLICSSAVGATSQFLESGINGWIFNYLDKNALKKSLINAIQSSNEDLTSMSINSYKIASKWTPHNWSNILLNLLRNGSGSK